MWYDSDSSILCVDETSGRKVHGRSIDGSIPVVSTAANTKTQKRMDMCISLDATASVD